MEEKKFDSVEDILKLSEEKHIPMYNIHLGFIVNLYDYLESECNSFIYGIPAKDFFIQGLISIAADPESFEQALESFMDKKNLL